MDRLRFGTFLAPNITPVYEAVAEEVGRRLGIETELVVETDYAACAEDKNEVCFVCSLPYVEFERQGIAPAVPIAAPVLEGDRYDGKPIYFSDVIVHRDSPFQSFLDLRGHSWAYNEPLSHSGYGITRYHLVESGETHGFFSEVIEAGFHETSMPLRKWTPPPSTPRCWRSRCATILRWPARSVSSTRSAPRRSSRSPCRSAYRSSSGVRSSAS
jgi:phosphonate transport system substrate-binding protein